jgi:predicted outer membrane lipoprotein
MFVIGLAAAFAFGVVVGIWLSEKGKTKKQAEKMLREAKKDVLPSDANP